MRQLTHILPVCGASLGGLTHIRVYPAENVLSIPAPVLGIISSPVVLRDPENYCDIFFPVGEGSMDEAQADDEHGEYFKPKISCFIPKDTPEFYDASIALTGMKCICICQDANGLAKLVGTPDYPLRFKLSTGTGKRSQDKSGLEFEFYGVPPERAPFYLSMNFIAPAIRKVFSSGFTFGFRRK